MAASPVTSTTDIPQLPFRTTPPESTPSVQNPNPTSHSSSQDLIPLQPLSPDPPSPPPTRRFLPTPRRLKSLAKQLCWITLSSHMITTTVLLLSLLASSLVNVVEWDYTSSTFSYRLDPRRFGTPFDPEFVVTNATVLMDAHVHTTMSDGRLTPIQTARWAYASGFDVIFVSDHNSLRGFEETVKAVEGDSELRGRLMVLPAMEFTCCTVHMNFLNLRTMVPPCGGEIVEGVFRERLGRCPFLTEEEVGDVIDKVHALGGLAMINHIPWSTKQNTLTSPTLTLPNHPTLTTLIKLGIDAVEVVNGETLDWKSIVEARQSNLTMMTGTDMHVPGVAKVWTLINPVNFTPEAVMEEIRGRRTSFLFDASGGGWVMPLESVGRRNWRYDLVRPLVGVWGVALTFVEYLKGMPSFQGGFCQETRVGVDGVALVMFLVYLHGFVIAFTLVISGVGSLWKWWMRRGRRRMRRKGGDVEERGVDA
ncbi:hypothetical protein HDU67_000334 [Dinochytrium kinnereticum]|nr:hypothetical protein HDU67_000334 [Dinochytrium kinnereticum]